MQEGYPKIVDNNGPQLQEGNREMDTDDHIQGCEIGTRHATQSDENIDDELEGARSKCCWDCSGKGGFPETVLTTKPRQHSDNETFAIVFVFARLAKTMEMHKHFPKEPNLQFQNAVPIAAGSMLMRQHHPIRVTERFRDHTISPIG